MSELTEFAVWFFGLPALVIFGMVFVFGAEWVVGKLETTAAHFQDRYIVSKNRAASAAQQRQDQQVFMTWISSKAGAQAPGGAVDKELVDAYEQGEIIQILLSDEIPNTVRRCAQTHRLMAQATGAVEMSEVAFEPECYQLRANVVWLLSHSVQFIESYPLRLNDARLVHNSVILRKRALPTCRRCPYIQLAVSQAPALCPTAALF